jgi:SAM-dependent methyltransferase
MNPEAMIPFALAVRAYFQGETEAQISIRRDDGFEIALPVRHFFRSASDFLPVEVMALRHCRGHVLDIGAGSGIHSLVLQTRGLTVTAIDIDPACVEIMSQRGVRDVQVADILEYRGGLFDTLLLLGHGIGMVENMHGLSAFLNSARRLTRSSGQVLIHSLDVRQTEDPSHRAYHETNRRAGRYIGETRLQFEFQGKRGPYCGWLHIDPEMLAEKADRTGWCAETICEEKSGDYLAKLIRQRED